MDDRNPLLATILAGIVILMIPVSVFVFFTSWPWAAFIPLGIIILSMVLLIGGFLETRIKEIEREENIL